MESIYVIILAGGSGTRLWPVSRALFPKQLQSFVGDDTLIQQTIARNKFSDNKLRVFAGEALGDVIAGQLHDLAENLDIFLEPEVKDTLPVCLLSALIAAQENPEALILLAPSDHFIEDPQNYQNYIKEAAEIAKSGKFVTFGITAKEPHTGYGYIEKGEVIKGNLFNVSAFHEKPNLEKAKQYVAQDKYLWNSGIFLVAARVLIDEIKKINPELLDLARQIVASMAQEDNKISFAKDLFSKLPKISIDYGLLEKTNNIAVCAADIKWSDLGSWSSVAKMSEADEKGNIISGENIYAFDNENVFIKSDNKKLITCLGAKDLHIINTDDALLVIDAKQTEKVKEIVNKLKEEKKEEAETGNKTFRHWGYYKILNEGKGHKTKELTLYPGKAISLQLHKQRAEHWVIVEGLAQVIKGEETKILHPNESIYISKNEKHRLSNIGNGDLKVIEVQTGEYLGEDDIIRFNSSR